MCGLHTVLRLQLYSMQVAAGHVVCYYTFLSLMLCSLFMHTASEHVDCC